MNKGISLPEQKANIQHGFLRKYWQAESRPPRLSSPEMLIYFISRGLRTVTSLPMSSAITCVTIAISIFMLAGFLLIMQNSTRLLGEAGTQYGFTVFFKEDATQQKVDEFVTGLANDPTVKKHSYVSKDQALEILKKELGGDQAGVLAGLSEDNPLPRSVNIEFYKDSSGIVSFDQVVEKYRGLDFVEQVAYPSELMQSLQKIIQVIRLGGAGLMLVVLLIVVFLISNTIKLVMFSRRQEISIMQLVGATQSYIKVPFFIGGFIQGFLGSILALIILKACHFIISAELSHQKVLPISFPEISFLTINGQFVIVGLGLLIGGLGSLFALRRYLDV